VNHVRITSREELRRNSPVEEALFDALLAEIAVRKLAITVTRQRPIAVEARLTLHVDLALELSGRRLAIEVDGFEFHHETRDQVERDYRRDRALGGLGWQVIRFLGREVNRDPTGCALEAVNVFCAGGIS
jgi:very-short-patch-repair endonuclease